jgi:hypothetical protein
MDDNTGFVPPGDGAPGEPPVYHEPPVFGAPDGQPPGYGLMPPAPPPPQRRRWLPWLVAAICFVVAFGAVGRLVTQKDPPPKTPQQELKETVDDAVGDIVSGDSAVGPDDEDRELKVTSPSLRQPFTVSVPKGFDARLSGRRMTAASEFAALILAPPRDGFAVNYAIEVTSLPAFGLAVMAQGAIDSNGASGLLPNFKPVGGPVRTSVGARPAVQRDYTFSQGSLECRGRLVVTVVGKQPVIFYLTTLAADFAAHEKTFAEFLATTRGN